MGVNSGFVNVKINLGLLDMGTNTPSGSLEVAYNGPKLRTCHGTLNGPFNENIGLECLHFSSYTWNAAGKAQ